MKPRAAALAILVLVICGLAWRSTVQPASGGSPPIAYTVNSTEDTNDGVCGFAAEDCTLREAIIASNASGGGNGIVFNLGAGTPKIDITQELPEITKTVTINGATGGATRVEIHGPGAAVPMNGLSVGSGAPSTQIRNLVINNFHGGGFIVGAGIFVNAQFVTVVGSFIGTSADGTAGVPNSVGINEGSADSQIGGTDGITPGGPCTGDCNLISGNIVAGIAAGQRDVVQGNFIGTDVSGASALPNDTGVSVGALSDGNVVGGIEPGAGNLISGNTDAGIVSQGMMTIQGNRVGTNATGTGPVPNRRGIVLGDGGDGSFIGGAEPGAGNLISGNRSMAIRLNGAQAFIQGNLIGTQVDGSTPLPNLTDDLLPAASIPLGDTESIFGAITIDNGHSTIGGFEVGAANTIAHNIGYGVLVRGQDALYNFIYGNSIHSNAAKGIENIDGGNQDINSPVIISANTAGASGTITSPTCLCGVQVYSDNEGQGRVFEGWVIADMSGNWSFTGSLDGPNVTALAYDDGGNTSEFSAPFDITPATPTPSPSPTPAQASPTPTPAATPTPTPTATPTSTATPTPTGVGQQVAWGDHNCSGSADPVDGLLNLRHDAGLSTETNLCPEMGASVDIDGTDRTWGDFDCSGTADPVDGLKVLRFDAGLDVARPVECPDPGEMVTVS